MAPHEFFGGRGGVGEVGDFGLYGLFECILSFTVGFFGRLRF